jgi:hypothetical protein
MRPLPVSHTLEGKGDNHCFVPRKLHRRPEGLDFRASQVKAEDNWDFSFLPTIVQSE